MPSAVVLGSKPGSYAALQLLIDKHWEIKAVVFSDTIQHKFIEGPDISDLAKKNKIPVYSSQKELPDLTCDFVISYMYRFLVKERVLNFAQRAAVNFHPGPLPEFGGWAFYNMAILEQSDEYGCTCHYMDNSFDTGDILKIRRFPIKHQLETAVSLERRTQKEMILLFMEFCELVEIKKPLPRSRQDKDKIRYLSKTEFDDLKKIPAEADSETIERIARAFWYPPYECAYIYFNNIKVEVLPESTKNELAKMYHSNDLQSLLKIISGD